MKLRICFWRILLHFLAVMCYHGSGASREMPREELMNISIAMDEFPEGVNNVLQLHSMDKIGEEDDGMEMEDNRVLLHGHGHDHKGGGGDMHGHGHGHGHGHSSSSSSASNMDIDEHYLNPADTIFFHMENMKPGKTRPIHFLKEEDLASSSSPSWLPKEVADSIPFSSAQLPHLLELFSLSPGSPEAKVVEYALRYCESDPIKGEIKLCPTSQESMLDFVGSFFELDSKNFRALSTPYLKKSATITDDLVQNYTLLEVPKEIPAPKQIVCHPVAYPYLIFYCHSLLSSKLYEVPLQNQNGDRFDALAVCHLDSTGWSPDYYSFRVLGTRPGSPVCHILPADSFIWIPISKPS